MGDGCNVVLERFDDVIKTASKIVALRRRKKTRRQQCLYLRCCALGLDDPPQENVSSFERRSKQQSDLPLRDGLSMVPQLSLVVGNPFSSSSSFLRVATKRNGGLGQQRSCLQPSSAAAEMSRTEERPTL